MRACVRVCTKGVMQVHVLSSYFVVVHRMEDQW